MGCSGPANLGDGLDPHRGARTEISWRSRGNPFFVDLLAGEADARAAHVNATTDELRFLRGVLVFLKERYEQVELAVEQ